MISISSTFDSGNIQVINATDINDIQLEINKDHLSDFYQWFHFRVNSDAVGQTHRFRIINAKGAAYLDGWPGYRAVASYDRHTWFRVDTEFDGENLIFNHDFAAKQVYFAYFAPYSYERHQDLLASCQEHPIVDLSLLGHTLDGRDMSLLTIGEPAEGKKKIWVIGRQHPGETMAEWFIEGLLDRLLDDEDAVAKALLQKAVLYVVPNMNPDGGYRGHLRTNAAGVNLNREWLTPSMDKSPEVYLVREQMLAIGVDMFLDIHGDEAIPHNFVAGSEGIPSYDARHAALEQTFKSALLAITPEFQDEKGYEKDKPGEANLTVASNWVAEQFKCLSYTVEMPFKDHNDMACEQYGWSSTRSLQFGRDTLAAVYRVVDQLR